MREPLDDDLARLFDEARVTLPPAPFLEEIQGRLARARRARLIRLVVFGTLVTVAVVTMTPYIASGSIAVVQFGGDLVAGFATAWGSTTALLRSVAMWTASLAVGVWVLRRSGVIGR